LNINQLNGSSAGRPSGFAPGVRSYSRIQLSRIESKRSQAAFLWKVLNNLIFG
jgi:hypothetical protein